MAETKRAFSSEIVDHVQCHAPDCAERVPLYEITHYLFVKCNRILAQQNKPRLKTSEIVYCRKHSRAYRAFLNRQDNDRREFHNREFARILNGDDDHLIDPRALADRDFQKRVDRYRTWLKTQPQKKQRERKGKF